MYGGGYIVPVKKRDGSLRLCADYRQLNSRTVATPFPIPRIDELLDKLKGSKYFTLIDLKSGYHHIDIAVEDQHKTAFVLPNGKYMWKKLPFGLIGAPFTFAEAMKMVLRGTETFAACYFDDILCHSPTLESHKNHVQQVLEKLGKSAMTIK